MIKKSLLAKNILMNIIIIAILVVAISGISYKLSAKQITEEIETQLSLQLESTTTKINNTRSNLEEQLGMIANLEDTKSAISGENTEILNELVGSFEENNSDYLENVFLIDETGSVVYDNQGNSMSGTDLSERQYFIDAMEGKVSHSDMVTSKFTGNKVEAAAVPVMDGDEVIGVLVASINIEYLYEILGSVKVGENGYAFLLDSQGNFIYHPKEELVGTNIKDAGVEALISAFSKMQQGKSGSVTYSLDGETKLNTYEPIGNWSLSINAVESEYLSAVSEILRSILITGAVALILGTLVSAINSSFMIKKIKKMKEVIGAVTAGNLTAELAEANLKKCWESKDCKENDCPAYGNENLKCWEIEGTLCDQEIQTDLIEKLTKCKTCGVYKVSEGDEISQIGRGLNTMISSIRGLVGSIREISKELKISSEEMSSASEETTVAAGEIASRMEEICAGTQDQTQYVINVNAMAQGMDQKLGDSVTAIENMSKKTLEVNVKATEGQSKIQSAISDISQIQKQTEKTAQVMENLNQRSVEIEKINELITEISQQTNLLSLNASIEAARAGEHGKGFAVVAGEIGQLANQSEISAKGIKELIEAIRVEISKADELMIHETQMVKQGIVSVKESEEAFNEINDKIKDVVVTMSEVMIQVEDNRESSKSVAEAVEKMSTILEESSGSAEEITATTQEQSSISEEIAKSADELTQMSNNLLEAVSQFHV